MLAHNCAQCGIHVDSWRLFVGDSPDYVLWLSAVVRMVNATNQAEAQKARGNG